MRVSVLHVRVLVMKLLKRETIEEKVEHVRAATQTRKHHCHWPGCTEQVPPAKWGCYKHWMKLPYRLRVAIWTTYRIGQEGDMTPSAEYIKVAQEVQEWIAQYLTRTQ